MKILCHISLSFSLFFFFCTLTEREKQVTIKGDEPTVHKQSRRSLKTDANSLNDETKSLKITTSRDLDITNENHVQLSGLGRYGCEWPSWLNNSLRTTALGLGSVTNHGDRNGSRLTDPECHEERRQHEGVGIFVTRAQTCESASSGEASCSSYCTDEESSSTESDTESDADNGYDSDSASSSSRNNNKWTTADGYHLTTFDQTERGTWPICQPLPLPLWNEKSKTPLIFDKVRMRL